MYACIFVLWQIGCTQIFEDRRWLRVATNAAFQNSNECLGRLSPHPASASAKADIYAP